MAKANGTTKGQNNNDGGDAGVLSDAELLGDLDSGLLDDLGMSGGLDAIDNSDSEEESEEEEADGDNDGAEEADEEESEEDSEEEADEEEEEESEEESEDEESEEEEKLPRSVKKLQKRVNTLTRRVKTAEEERDTLRTANTELQTKLEKAAPVTLAPTQENPLADLATEQSVQDRITQMKSVRRWCNENIEGYTGPGADGQEITVDAKTVRKRLAMADEVINEHGPARIKFLKDEAMCDDVARKVFPGLFNSSSQESKIYHSFIEQLPELKRLPNHRLIVGDAIRGGIMRARAEAEAKAKKEGQGKTEKKAPRSLKSKPAPTISKRKADLSRGAKRALTTGDDADILAMIEEAL